MSMVCILRKTMDSFSINFVSAKLAAPSDRHLARLPRAQADFPEPISLRLLNVILHRPLLLHRPPQLLVRIRTQIRTQVLTHRLRHISDGTIDAHASACNRQLTLELRVQPQDPEAKHPEPVDADDEQDPFAREAPLVDVLLRHAVVAASVLRVKGRRGGVAVEHAVDVEVPGGVEIGVEEVVA